MIIRTVAIGLALGLNVAPAAVLAAQATPAHGSDPVKLRGISGTVADKEGNVLSDADVAIVEHDTVTRRTRTGDNGRFRLESVDPGVVRLRVRRVGFQVAHVTVDPSRLDRSVFIALDPVIGVLAPVNVDADETEKKLSPQLTDFYARARRKPPRLLHRRAAPRRASSGVHERRAARGARRGGPAGTPDRQHGEDPRLRAAHLGRRACAPEARSSTT